MKKILAVLLLLMCQMMIVQAANNTSYDGAKQIIEASGVDMVFADAETVSRGQFVAAIVDFMGIGKSDKSPFYDVGEGVEFAGQILGAYERGIISGRENKMFYPAEPITYNEAITICITVTGRKTYAIANGGYPAGFNYTANSLELNKKVVARGDSILSGNDALWLLFNTFNTTVLEADSFGEYVHMSSANGNTMFSLYKNIKHIEGIVSANRFSGLYAASERLLTSAKIGNIIIGDEQGRADEFLGLYCDAYYFDDGQSALKMIWCGPVEKENNITRIEAKDCFGFNETTNVFTYLKNNTNKRKTVAPTTPIIYNRSTSSVRTNDMFTPEMGYIELIDNNDDSRIDVVRITEREIFVVFAYDKENDILYDKFNNSIDLSENNNKFIVIEDMTGETMPAQMIEEGMVVTAEIGVGGNVVYAIVSEEKIYGSANALNTEEDGKTIVVAEETFYLSPQLASNVPAGITSPNGGIFYLDAYGIVADFKGNGDEIVYSISVYNNNDEPGLLYRFMNAKGNIELVKIAQRYKINGQSLYANDGIPTIIERGDIAVIVRNNEGEITSIKTPDSGGDIISFGGITNLTYSEAVASFNGKFSISDNTIIMNCPMPSEGFDENDYTVLDKAEIADGESYYVRAFVDGKNSIIPDAVVIYNPEANSIKKADDCVLVKKIIDTVNSDNIPIKRLVVCRRDKEVTIDCENTALLTEAGIGVGDIIKLSQNRNGLMVNVDKIYSARTNAFNSSSAFAKDNGMRNGFRLVGGNVYNREDNVIGIYNGNPAGISHTQAEYFTIPEDVTGSIYVVDTHSSQVVTKGGMYSIKDHKHFGTSSKVLIYTRYAVMRMIVIYQ